MPWRAVPDRVDAYTYCRRYWRRYGHPIVTGDSEPTAPFNRAQARNNAVKHATTDVIILADADTIPADYSTIEQAIALAETGAAVWPYTTYRLLTDTDIADPADIPALREWQTKWRPGGICVIHRDTYIRVGGYDERFGAGWGYEDGAFHLACTTLADTHHLPGYAYAFNHGGSRRRDSRNRRHYMRYQAAAGDRERMSRLVGRVHAG